MSRRAGRSQRARDGAAAAARRRRRRPASGEAVPLSLRGGASLQRWSRDAARMGGAIWPTAEPAPRHEPARRLRGPDGAARSREPPGRQSRRGRLLGRPRASSRCPATRHCPRADPERSPHGRRTGRPRASARSSSRLGTGEMTPRRRGGPRRTRRRGAHPHRCQRGVVAGRGYLPPSRRSPGTRSSSPSSRWRASRPWQRCGGPSTIPIAADESVDNADRRRASQRARRLRHGDGEALQGRGAR